MESILNNKEVVPLLERISAQSFQFAQQFIDRGVPKHNLVACEAMYLLLSNTHQIGSNIIGENEYWDSVPVICITAFSVELNGGNLKKYSPEVNSKLHEEFLNRTSIYGRIRLYEESEPTKMGTQMFAFCYYLHRILEPSLKETNVNEILLGKNKPNKSNSHLFPTGDDSLNWISSIRACFQRANITQPFENFLKNHL